MSGPLVPRFHGNGFIQVYLNSLTRLHIWSPEFPQTRVQNARIHSHRFAFRSKVLLGCLHDDQYEVRHCPNTGADGDLYDIPEASSNVDKSAPLRFLEPVTLRRTELRLYPAGMEYVEDGYETSFHDSYADQLTVTVMTKIGNAPPGTWARVVCKDIGIPPDHAFENQPSQTRLVAEVARVMELLL